MPRRRSAHNSPVPVTEVEAVVVFVASVWDSLSTPWLSLLFFRVVFWYCIIAMLFCSCSCSDAVDFAPNVSFTSPWSDQLIVFEIENSTVSVTVILTGSVPLMYVCLEIMSGGGCVMSLRSSTTGTPMFMYARHPRSCAAFSSSGKAPYRTLFKQNPMGLIDSPAFSVVLLSAGCRRMFRFSISSALMPISSSSWFRVVSGWRMNTSLI